MKRITVVFFIFVFFLPVFISCYIVDVKPDPSPVISLNVNNKYIYHNKWSAAPPFPATSENWSEQRIIERVTLDSVEWYKFDTSTFRRVEEEKVFKLQNDSIYVEFDFSLSPGDRTLYNDVLVEVISIEDKIILGERVTVFELSNEQISSDTLIIINYAKKFGFISSARVINYQISSSELVAAIINGTEYGDKSLLRN